MCEGCAHDLVKKLYKIQRFRTVSLEVLEKLFGG